MTLQFFDMEHEDTNPRNGTTASSADELISLLEDARRRDTKPFCIRLAASDGYELGIGIGDPGFVQHEPSNGNGPCLIAVRPGVVDDDEVNYADDEERGPVPEFLAGGTPSPIPWRFALPFDLVKKIAVEYLETGKRSRAVTWYG
jgi:hypothetical protein